MLRSIFSFILLAAFVTTSAHAQVQLRVPRISQGAKVSQAVGLSEIAVSYSRPGVKGRTIWGGLLPYDTVWRAGANEPTLITFSDDATIEGKKLKAGTYRFLVVPARSGEWTIVFNSETKNWGTVYEPQYDSVKVKVVPESGPNEEWLSFSFTDLTPVSARVILAWEKIRLGFKVEFNTLEKLQGSVGNWQTLNNAARFALDNKLYSGEGLAWVDRSISLDKNPRNLQTKAELLAQAGKVADAISVAEEAVSLAKAKNPKANTSGLEKLIAAWKTNK